MRVINHKQLKEERLRKLAKRRKKRVLWFVMIVGCLGFGLLYTQRSAAPSDQQTISHNIPASAPKKGVLKTYTPQQFRDLYNNFAYPNTQEIGNQTAITGNHALDERIREIAAERGYVVRSAPVANTFQAVAPAMLLQQRASQPWLDMQAAAKKDKILLDLSAAYRSADEQLSIFLSRFAPRTASEAKVASGAFDQQIIETLSMTAPPGYSRHHTGYTIDIICDNNIDQVFDHTDCFKWLSAENYKNAKTHGWIPSYPEGIDSQGPEPETWEYVWVGTDTLTE